MERTTWGQINELFEAARRLPAGEREAWVRAATADERVQSEVLSLLHAHEDDPWFIDEPAGSRTPPRVTPAKSWPGSPAPVPPGRTPSQAVRGRQASTPSSEPPHRRRAPEPKAGGQFATYRLIREMSRDPARITFEAVATGGSARARVALHVLTADARDPAFAALLHVQGDILAHLDHPRIPRLLDGGVTGDGTAYLAFEYAAGDPIDVWCRDRGLSVRDRVCQVLAVCEAVQHVHEHLISHGDLRPATILVSADAEVRLLDCGMSPLLGFGLSPGGTAALLHQCMSPEQARGEVPMTASDVYGLGILLYTLVTGYPPYDLSGQTPARALHSICEIEPDVPSAIVGGRDGRKLAGTLDRIILKALRKNPRERYVTAAALGADLRAWRDGLPTSVAPATRRSRTITRGGRAVRIGAVAIALIAPLAGAAVLGWQASLLRGERDQVRTALADTYRRLAELQARTAGADPANLVTAAASLDAAAATGEQALAADPRSASAAVTLAGTYGDLVGVRLAQGDAAAAGKAEARLRALVDQLTRDLPRDAQARVAAASGYVRLGTFHEAVGEAVTAKVMYGNAIAAFETLAAEGRLADADRAQYARAQRRLGGIALQGGAFDDAERLLLAAQAFDTGARRPLNASARREMADTLGGLALVARQRGGTPRAESLWTQALTVLQASASGAPADMPTLEGLAEARSSLGSLCRSQRRFTEALAHYREALRVRERESGMTGAPPAVKLSLAVTQVSVARLLLDLVEVREPGPNDAVRLREAGALLAQAGPAVRAAAPSSPAQQDALAELDRQSERLRRLTSRRR